MRRLAAALVVAAAAVALAAAAVAAPVGGGTVEQRWQSAKTHVVLVMGTSDYAPGDVRVSFLVAGSDGKLIEAPGARLSLARGQKQEPFATGAATLVALAPRGGTVAADDVQRVFVGRIRVPAPGTYWLLAELDGVSVSGLGNLVVHAKPEAPAVGDRAPASATPTLATVRDPARLTTRVPPDLELLRVSVAGALRRHWPFVVVFATPKFCTSRLCGPAVDVVDAARKRWQGTPVRFIHVEIYTDNIPSKGPNRWVTQWRLPSEPWVFLVGADGRVKARFEGALSQGELEAAIQARLGIAAPQR